MRLEGLWVVGKGFLEVINFEEFLWKSNPFVIFF